MDTLRPKFEHSVLEKDIGRLLAEVKEHKEKSASPEISDREAVRSALSAIIQAQPAPPPSSGESGVLPSYLQKESPEIRLKIEELIDLAFHKGIENAVAEAKKYGPFILDGLHDSLTGRIYDELKTRKLL